MPTTLYSYSLPLVGQERKAREGLLIAVQTEEGQTLWGEASPLPGFSKESLKEAFEDLKLWVEKKITPRTPSAKWAVDMLAMQAGALKNNKTPTSHVPQSLPVAILLTPDRKNIPDLAGRTVKVKVGQEPLNTFTERLSRIFQEHRPQSIRIDANRAWTLEEALAFANALQKTKLPLEYIEEPCKNPKDIKTFIEHTRCPVALDESLYLKDWNFVSHLPSMKAVVCKPTLMGGLQPIKDLAEKIKDTDAYMVFSSSYESGVGTAILAQLAFVYQHPGTAVGLDPYHLLAADVCAKRLAIDKVVRYDISCGDVKVDVLRRLYESGASN